MLRRMSVHAAGLNEPRETYVWETLKSSTFAEGAAGEFNNMTPALREYALAGVLHLEHFALIRTSAQYAMLKRRTLSELTRSLAEPPEVVASGLERLLQQHEVEWSAFTRDLGEGSFVRKWIDTLQ
jgi:hypothetical protein